MLSVLLKVLNPSNGLVGSLMRSLCLVCSHSNDFPVRKGVARLADLGIPRLVDVGALSQFMASNQFQNVLAAILYTPTLP